MGLAIVALESAVVAQCQAVSGRNGWRRCLPVLPNPGRRCPLWGCVFAMLANARRSLAAGCDGMAAGGVGFKLHCCGEKRYFDNLKPAMLGLCASEAGK